MSGKYMCPSCGNEMFWTGNARQIGKCAISDVVFIYKCINPRCDYKSEYKKLDDASIESMYDDEGKIKITI